YYVRGNTAEGQINLLSSNIHDLNYIYILKHPSHTVQSLVLQGIIDFYKKDKANEIEVFNSPLGNKFMDGLVLRNQSIAIITDSIATKDLDVIELNLETFFNYEMKKANGYKMHLNDELHKKY